MDSIVNGDQIEKPKKGKRKIRKEFIIIIGLLMALLVVYLIGCLFFNHKFLSGTYVNDVNISGMTIDEANDKLAKRVDARSLELIFNDGTSEVIVGKECGVNYNLDNDIKKVLRKQNSFNWVFAYFVKNKHEVSNLVNVDETVLLTKVNSLSHVQADVQVAPVDAKVEYVNNEFVITPENLGSTIDTNKLVESIKIAFSEGKDTLNLTDESSYVQPSLKSDSETIVQLLDAAKQYASANITYNTRLGDVVLDGSTLITWLSVDESGKYYRDDATFKEKATTFVSELAKKVNSTGETRTFVGANNRTVTVSGGNYGVKLQNSKEVEGLLEDIYENKVETRTPITTGKQASVDNGGLGDTFIEIDLSGQHLWYHQNGEIVMECDIVSGKYTDPDRRTPAGTYYIYNKERNRVLRGTKLPDGTWPYETPVDYWMPFNKGIGIHDSSTWRKAWGGTIYMNNGSHGCINVPTSSAAKLYGLIEVNCPVVCYYL